MACPASDVLPRSESTNEYARRGTAVHMFIERARKIGREHALTFLGDDVDDDTRALCAAINLDELPSGGDYEFKLAWDYETDKARVVDNQGHRNYPAGSGTEFFGTADFLGRDGDAVVVLDYKTGRRYLGPARDSWQLRMLALAACRLTGLERARVAYFFLRDDGSVATSWATLDAMDLAETADALRELAARTPDPTATVEAEHCDYCPSWSSCPAKTALARAIGDGSAIASIDEATKTIAALSDDQLGEVFAKIERYNDVAERVTKAIRERASFRAIMLGNGRVLGTVDWPTSVVHGEAVYQTLARVRGTATAEAACPRRPTLTSIKRAAGAEGLALVEQEGGVVQVKTKQVRVHRAKENGK
jgi:hypothetical protein